jgi:hypothetical protein
MIILEEWVQGKMDKPLMHFTIKLRCKTKNTCNLNNLSMNKLFEIQINQF